MDSFYEYLLKSYVLFEEKSDLERFLDVYRAIKQFMRRGRRHCNHGDGPHPHYVNVNIESGDTFTQWVDSLQAAIPGLQVSEVQEMVDAFYIRFFSSSMKIKTSCINLMQNI